MISKLLLYPYYLTLKIRNHLYDSGKIETRSFDIPVISIGNVNAGGTGKTPMVEQILRLAGEQTRTAVVSRGYKRKGKGIINVECESDALSVGDEPLQIKKKFPLTKVVVAKDRVKAIEQLCKLPDDQKPQLIILDDGLQYRRIQPKVHVVMIDYYKPIFKDELLPIGSLRDLPQQIRRANCVVMSKSPEYLDQWEREKSRKITKLRPEQIQLFSKINYCPAKSVFEEGDKRYIYSKEVYFFSGIADDTMILSHLTDNYDWIAHKKYPDHHRFSRMDIIALQHFAESHPRCLLLTTEKDAQRLLCCKINETVKKRLFYLPIESEFLLPSEKEEFCKILGLEAGRKKQVVEPVNNGLLF